MFGLEQIKEANENPESYAQSNLSDGQRRRNVYVANAFWSDSGHADMPETKPNLYFEAVKLNAALESLVLSTQGQQAQLRKAMFSADWPLVEILMRDILLAQPDIVFRIMIDELANTIDSIAPPNPKGYVPHMGLHHAMHPIRKIVNTIRTILSKSV